MSQLLNAIKYARMNDERYLTELKELLTIPSISTFSENKPDMRRAAEWIAQQLRGMNLNNVQVMPTDGHPVVYGESLGAQGKPTVLVYGHYDVQPADPLDEWTNPPFDPVVRGDNIYARGASDMKGQLHAFLKALEALGQNGDLPLNVKVIVEGEEEIGSPHLEGFIAEHKAKLKCVVALNADSTIVRPDLPSLVYGLRGLAYFEVRVHGAKQDLHSGMFGGSVRNPAQVLCELIAGMHDEHSRVTLPGFYDKVRVLSDEERMELARLPHSDEEWKKTAGVTHLHGETDFTTLQRLGARPTLEVNGVLSGFTGEGSKTVLPAKAMAKISMRLVPQQDDKEVEHQLRAYLKQHVPEGVRWEVKSMVSAPAVLVRRDTPAAHAAEKALEETFGVKPVWKLEGGSVPVVNTVQQILGVDSILMGFGLPDDNIHSPNEKLHLPTYYRGIEAYIRFFDNVGQIHL
jgi:acetylornithine deacetylase/succinyl-diaminopimelate desuccinylase-like protein